MLDNILRNMKPISLEEMTEVKLMNRFDAKYLTTLSKLEQLLKEAERDFLIQEIDGVRNSSYYTCYFDTTNFKMYCDHERGKKTRKKIRIREYLETGTLPFLEIKDKNNKGKTKKRRVPMELGKDLELYKSFVSDHTEFNVEELNPKIENRFKRITLVNIEKTERITIDTSIEFHNFVSGREIMLPQLAVIEWKRDGQSKKSRLKPLLQTLRIHESGFSKYVIGMAMTDSYLPQHKIKPRLHLIQKMIK